ncbi:MAG: hypothetical protein EBU97_04805, partial [Rhodobacteraceae bacterium]|nr:hypothetical protein [Paracoccaceae bacterium]
WNAELVAKPVTDDGKLVIEFRIFPPVSETPTGTPQSRQITAALALSDIKLAPVTEIIVQGAQNARAARR